MSFTYDPGKIVGASVVLSHFKNNLKQLPMILFLPLNLDNVQCCPVKAIQCYCIEYKHTTEPLFQFHNGSPITYAFVADKLNSIIKYLGLDHLILFESTLQRPHIVTVSLRMMSNAWAVGNLVLFVSIFASIRFRFQTFAFKVNSSA